MTVTSIPASNQVREVNEEKSLADRFMQAIVDLDDLDGFRKNPAILGMRTELLRVEKFASEDVVRSMELKAISKMIRKRFEDSHRESVDFQTIWNLTSMIDCWAIAALTVRTESAKKQSGISPGLRRDLSKSMFFIHQYGIDAEGAISSAAKDAGACLCPATAYLQLVLQHTPMQDWVAAEAAATTDPSASPLATAWAWARRSPVIGKRTADVAALLAMGWTANIKMIRETMNAQELQEKVATAAASKRGWWTTITSCFSGWATPSPEMPSSSTFGPYQRMSEQSDHSDDREIREEVRTSMVSLNKVGNTYSYLLRLRRSDRELGDLVETIRASVSFILGKVEPPVSDKLFRLVGQLASASSDA